jgi:hypothetical protein
MSTYNVSDSVLLLAALGQLRIVDGCAVRATKGLAARAGDRSAPVLQNPRGRLRRVRDESRTARPCGVDLAVFWNTDRDATGQTVGDRPDVSCASHYVQRFTSPHRHR